MALALVLMLGLGQKNIVRAETPVDVTTGITAGTASTISVWYGNTQTYTLGTPQQWINLLGNVTDVDGDLSTVQYALNTGSAITLSPGPDNRRLLGAGDFNVELDVSTLNNGANTVVITATDAAGNQSTQTINFTYDAAAVWTLPYTIQWNTIGTAIDAVQPVDGKWTVSAAGIRTVDVGYDRIIGLGDRTWTDFEVTIPITVHSLDTSAYGNPYSVGPGMGLVMRWQGHTNNPVDCTGTSGIHCGWNPQGGNPWYEWTQDGSGDGWRLDNNQFSAADPLSRTMTLGTPYFWKLRGQTTISGTLYQFKVWESSTAEPAGWQMSGVETPNAFYLDSGSLLLVAHHVDATFGDVTITPVLSPTLTVGKTGQGTVAVNPNQPTQPYSYTYGTVVTLTATPALNHVFAGWQGDIDGQPDTTNPLSLTMNGDRVVTATFTTLVSYTLSASAGTGGAVVASPDRTEYLSGTVVALTGAADVGWAFSGWGGDASGSANPTAVTMDANKNVSAAFALLPAGTLASDDFDGCGLANEWTPLAGLPGDPAPMLVSNTLVLSVPAGLDHDFQGADVFGNRVMQSVADGDFEMVVKFNSAVTRKYQTQGIVIRQKNGDTLRLEVLNDGSNRFYAAKILGGVSTQLYSGSISPNQTPPYLKVNRTGDLWTYSYSFDNTGWISINFTQPFTVATVGVYGGNASLNGVSAPAHTAIVDYVYNSPYPGAGDVHPPQTHTVQVNVVGAGNYTITPTGTSFACGTPVTITAVADAGAKFDGWSGHASGTLTQTAMTMTADRVLTATFSTQTYALAIATDGNGTIDVSPTGPYALNQTVTVTATPATGWIFSGWSGDLGGTTNPAALTMTADKSITATFTALQYSVSANVQGGGAVQITPTGTYTYGQIITLTAAPQAGWQLQQWNGAVNSPFMPTTTLTVQGNHVVTATFAPVQYTLLLTTTGGGVIAANPAAGSYSYGQTVTLTATADLGFTFIRWEGDASGTGNPITLTMTADKTARAVFSALISYTLTTGATAGGAVVVSPEQTDYLSGTVVTLTGAADVGWYFSGWNGDTSGATNPVTITMDADKTVQGDFTALPAGAFASDDFDACALNSAWTFYEGLSGDPAPDVAGGVAQWTVPAGVDHDIWSNGVNVPRIVQSVSDTDFELVVRFVSTFTQRYQTHGFVVEAGNGDALRFEFFYDGSAVTLFGAAVIGGAPTSKYLVNLGAARPPYMRLKRVGDTWTHGYSFDGQTWTEQSFTQVFPMTRLGIYGGNSSDSGSDAPAYIVKIDYVYNTAYPGIGDIRAQTPKQLAIATVGNGSVAKNPDLSGYACGTVVTLTATADTGATFGGWSGDASGTTNPITVTVTANRAITATFNSEYFVFLPLVLK